MDNPDPDNNFWSRRRWLARFAFSFLLIAFYLGYVGYQGALNHTLSRNRVILLYFAAMLSFVLFVMGTRERHRR
jgi:hypothetical protein